MAVDDATAILQEGIAVGFSGGPVWSTSRTDSISGYSQRNQMRARPVHQYSLRGAEQDRTSLLTLKNFHMGRRGSLRSWLLKDWSDYAATGQTIGAGDGVTTAFQLVKTYDAVNPYSRDILYVKSGTLAVYVDSVLQTDPTHYSESNGVITFVTAPANSLVVTADFEFYVPVTFVSDEFTIEIAAKTGEWGSTGALDAIEELEAT